MRWLSILAFAVSVSCAPISSSVIDLAESSHDSSPVYLVSDSDLTVKNRPESVKAPFVIANNTSHRLKRITEESKEFVLSTVSFIQNVKDLESNKIAQAVTSFLFYFDLEKAYREVEGVVRMDPTMQRKISTFSTFLPDSADNYFSLELSGTNTLSSSQDDAPWANVITPNDIYASSSLEVSTLANHSRSLVVSSQLFEHELETLIFTLPPVKKTTYNYATSWKKVVVEYYRGSDTNGLSYSQAMEAWDFAKTIALSLTGILSLSVVCLAVVAIVSGIWTTASRDDDEKDVDEKASYGEKVGPLSI